MIKEFIDRFERNKEEIQEYYENNTNFSYEDLVRNVINNITSTSISEFCPDPDRIHVIDDGDYQGTQVYVIGEKGYQPHKYYYVKIWYGSCSGCDALEAALDSRKEQMVKDCMLLSLHIVQNIKVMDYESVG